MTLSRQDQGRAAAGRSPRSLSIDDLGVFDLLRQWNQYLEASGRASPRTRATYRYRVLRFLADVLADPLEVTEQGIIDHLLTLDPRGGHRADLIRALKSFYSWAEHRELIRRDPTRTLRIPRPRPGRAPALSVEDLTRLCIAAAWHEPRRAWSILFVYGTGARIGSAVEVRPSDIRGGRVHLRVTKGDRPYDVPLVGVAAEAVDELLQCPRPVHALPSAPYRDRLIGVGSEGFRLWLRDAGRDSGVKAWPHLLRDTFATRVYDATKDPVLVADLLNHRDLSQIRRYVAVDDDHKREALRRL